VTSLDKLYSKITTMIILPENMREDAIEFIKNINSELLIIMTTNPNIDHTMQIDGEKLYDLNKNDYELKKIEII